MLYQALLSSLTAESDLSTEHAVFDLDHTTLTGDIGDAVFTELENRGELSDAAVPLGDPASGTIASGLPGAAGDLLVRARDETHHSFYQRVLRQAQSEVDPERLIAAIYLWMTCCQAGLTQSQIEAATNAAWHRSSAINNNESGDDNDNEPRTPQLGVRAEILELMIILLERGAKVHIVSATSQVSVSWVVKNVINPLLAQRNPNLQIPAHQVNGVRSVASPIGEDLESRYSDELIYPTPTFAGKAALVKKMISERPLLVAGDSPNDFAMLSLAQRPVWISRPQRPHLTESFMARFSQSETTVIYT